MTADELQRYLHAHIPLSRHMQLRVERAQREQQVLHLPLAPNVNPHGTIFGGALSAAGLVGGWMLLHAAFVRAGIEAMLVGKEGRCEFLAPATDDCTVETRCDAAQLDALLDAFRQRGRARQSLTTILRVGAREVARHHGVYTALRHDYHPANRNPE